MTHVLEIPYDDDVLLRTSLGREEFEREAPVLLAGKLYELGRLSSGRAAKLCGMERVDFLMNLPRIGVAISNLRPDDVDDDIRFARRL
jgi:predicted HTH domain antitoxin